MQSDGTPYSRHQVRQLIANDPGIVSRPNKNRSTPFHAACALGELAVAKLLERAHKEHCRCDTDVSDNPDPLLPSLSTSDQKHGEFMMQPVREMAFPYYYSEQGYVELTVNVY